MTDKEYEDYCDQRNEDFLAKHGRPMNYQDVIASFGGHAMGQTVVLPRRRDENKHSRSQDKGLTHE
jgi:hypothetical protein